MTATSNEARTNEPARVNEPAEADHEAPGRGTASAAARSPRGRSSWWNRLGIQSKLLAMLLGVSILSALVAGVIGYRSGTESLREAVFDRLTAARESRAREVTQVLTNMTNTQVIYTQGATAIEAAEAFTAGFAELQQAGVTPEQDAAVRAYYENVFVPGLVGASDRQAEADVFLPQSPAQRYLQAVYTAPHTDFDQAIAVDDAGDGSAWSAAHARFHPFFRELTQRLSYEDALILDTEGNVVYSAYKGVDLGTNVDDGPFSGTSLQAAYDAAMLSNTVDFVTLTDFERYQPSLGVPTAWAVSPIGDDGQISGALALQLPISTINDVMTGEGQWRDDGLGETGEIYLVGRDGLMRSVSRLLLEDPEHFAEDVVSAGTPRETADRMVEVQGSILLQNVETGAVNDAFRGRSGTAIETDYHGHEVLAAYAPLEVPEVDWSIVAQIDSEEAFHPVHEFARNLALSIAGIILAVSLASLVLAQVFARPVRRLLDGVRKVAAGDLTATVEPTSRDEFGDLAVAFNDMSHSLRTKAELIDEQQAENERLLLTMMPEPVARRYRGGDETIAEDHSNVSVVFAEIAGFDAFTAGLRSDESLALLNEIVRGFDDAAGQLGIENVRTLREGYLASCGLVVPRVDHVRRTVDFAREMHNVVSRFNSRHGSRLALRAGINLGTVTSGLVGQASLKYDLWGDAVNLAYRVEGVAGEPGIYVTADVYDRLRDTGYEFAEAAPVQSGEDEVPVWRLVLEDAS